MSLKVCYNKEKMEIKMKKTLILIAAISTIASANTETKTNQSILNISHNIIKTLSIQYYAGYTIYKLGKYIQKSVKEKPNKVQ